MLVIFLLVVDALILVGAGIFTRDSIREKEYRASRFGYAGVIFAIFLAVCILWVPALRLPIAGIFALGALFGAVFLIPGKPNLRALQGTMGYVVAQVKRFDERDTVFARHRIAGGGEKLFVAIMT